MYDRFSSSAIENFWRESNPKGIRKIERGIVASVDVLNGALAGTHCILAINVDHQHRLQHVALGHGAGATAHADWAVSLARAQRVTPRSATRR
eukprot:6227407-Pyramimonas_sp.AAC.1